VSELRTCKDCAFSVGPYSTDEQPEGFYECRRYPPRFDPEYCRSEGAESSASTLCWIFPLVDEDGLCGEFKDRPARDPAA
jgi:hypothetical protein